MARVHSQYVRIRRRNPRAVGMCDQSGFRVMRYNIQKQMEYNAKGLYWTGFWVEKRFMDQPNQQNLKPYTGADPYPIPDSRPDIPFETIVPRTTFDVSTLTSPFVQTQDQYPFLNQTYIGTLTADLNVVFPCVVANWTISNYTQGNFALTFKQVGLTNSYPVPRGETVTFYSSFHQFAPGPLLRSGTFEID